MVGVIIMYQLNGYDISIDHVLEQAKTYIKNPDSIAIIEKRLNLRISSIRRNCANQGNRILSTPLRSLIF